MNEGGSSRYRSDQRDLPDLRYESRAGSRRSAFSRNKINGALPWGRIEDPGHSAVSSRVYPGAIHIQLERFVFHLAVRLRKSINLLVLNIPMSYLASLTQGPIDLLPTGKSCRFKLKPTRRQSTSSTCLLPSSLISFAQCFNATLLPILQSPVLDRLSQTSSHPPKLSHSLHSRYSASSSRTHSTCSPLASLDAQGLAFGHRCRAGRLDQPVEQECGSSAGIR
jgi:hypothetical protein